MRSIQVLSKLPLGRRVLIETMSGEDENEYASGAVLDVLIEGNPSLVRLGQLRRSWSWHDAAFRAGAGKLVAAVDVDPRHTDRILVQCLKGADKQLAKVAAESLAIEKHTSQLGPITAQQVRHLSVGPEIDYTQPPLVGSPETFDSRWRRFDDGNPEGAAPGLSRTLSGLIWWGTGFLAATATLGLSLLLLFVTASRDSEKVTSFT